MSHTALNYSKWDSLEEPSDDEDTGACIGLPGRDGGPGTVYRWEELRTELPWQQQRPDDEPVVSHASNSLKHEEIAKLGPGTSLNQVEPPAAPAALPVVSVAPAEPAAPPAEPPPAAAQSNCRPAQDEGPSTAAEPVGATSAAPLRIRCARDGMPC